MKLADHAILELRLSPGGLRIALQGMAGAPRGNVATKHIGRRGTI